MTKEQFISKHLTNVNKYVAITEPVNVWNKHRKLRGKLNETIIVETGDFNIPLQ